MANDTEPLLSAYHFNYTQRPRRDKAWALAYYLLLFLTLGWALINLILRPDLVAVLSSPDYLDDPSNCPPSLARPTTHGRTAVWLTRTVAAAREAIAPTARRAGAGAGTGATLKGDLLSSVARVENPWPAGCGNGLSSTGVGRGGCGALEAEAKGVEGFGSRESAGAEVEGRPRRRVLGSAAADDGDGPVPRILLNYGGLLLLMSLAAAVVLAFLFVLALRHSPWALVLLSCVLQVAAPLVSAGVAGKAGNSTLALLLLLLAAAIAVSLYCGRKSLALVSRLLGVAAVALRENAALLGLVAALKVALAGATALLMAATAVVAAAGDVVPNPLRDGSPRCATPRGQPVACCSLAPPPALPAYLPAAGITLAWTLLLLFEVKVYVVSGVVAQWYFSPAGHLAAPGYNTLTATAAGMPGPEAVDGGAADGAMLDDAEHDGPAGGARVGRSGCCLVGGFRSSRALVASLGHAMGPSFGSLCAASGVLGATVYVRAVVNSITSRTRNFPDGLPLHPGAAGRCACAAVCCCCCFCLAAVIRGCCWCVVSVLEQLTKFATVQMSMSGLGFWKASCEVVALLRRNFMDAYNMWWYLPMVLHCGAAAFSAAWGYTAFWIARQCWAPFTSTSPLNQSSAAILGALAAATSELVLSFVCSVLVNIADALFICFVLDRDSGAVTWYDLHCVFATLPCCAAARISAEGHHHHSHSHYGSGGYSTGGVACTGQSSYYYVSPAAYGGPVSYGHYAYLPAAAPQRPSRAGPALGRATHAVGYGASQPRPQYGGGYGGAGGFWGWLRSPSGSGSGAYGMPVGGSRYRNDRPQYPPPAVLSPPYSDQQFPVRQPLGPPPPAAFFGSLARQS